MVVCPAADVVKKFLYSRVGVARVVCCEAAALDELRVEVFEVLRVPLLVRVQENKIKRPLQVFNQLMGISESSKAAFPICSRILRDLNACGLRLKEG